VNVVAVGNRLGSNADVPSVLGDRFSSRDIARSDLVPCRYIGYDLQSLNDRARGDWLGGYRHAVMRMKTK
jgi:hypothetical protein